MQPPRRVVRGLVQAARPTRGIHSDADPKTVLGYVKSEPFRPFRLHVASGRVFDMRHPEMITVLRSNVLVFKTPADGSDIPDEYDNVSLMLTESISFPETSSIS